MYAIATFLLLLICIAVHEFGHAYAILRQGIKVKEIGLGIPTWKYLGFNFDAPSWLPCEKVGFHILLVGGYTKPAEGQEEKLNELGYWDYANIMGAGIWANFLMAIVVGIILVLFFSELTVKQSTSIALALSVLTLVLWFGQKLFTGIIFPALAPATLYLFYLVFTSDSAASGGGPIEVFKQVGSKSNWYESLIFISDISFSLALLNSLPILPLDGGRLYHYLIGKVSRTAQLAYLTGSLIVALLLIVFIFSRDIYRLFV
jgi:membrane-associated protease RseP (regulator of RpoE activity)